MEGRRGRRNVTFCAARNDDERSSAARRSSSFTPFLPHPPSIQPIIMSATHNAECLWAQRSSETDEEKVRPCSDST